jgi:alpha-L-fucosidase
VDDQIISARIDNVKRSLFYTVIGTFLPLISFGQAALPRPSEIQFRWHEQERIMFVCLDPCTWQGREYDNHTVPLDRINPTELSTDQWCETARLWGAQEILFVAKHTGGFCWWQTETNKYGIKETPYKNGKGDVLLELSRSCKKYRLNLGIYLYPGDETWGAGIGSGGRTGDPVKQEDYNEIYRTQLTEVLTNYGDIIEVWFDGSCVIDVSDIMEKYAKNSVIFQGPHATLRWAGTESGKLFYPLWNTVNSEDFNTGVSTQVHDDPNGDVWAPLETNTTLYEHYWFWSPQKAKHQKSLEQLMECYYKSIGYGSVFLLNSTPDTTGLIPEEDIKLYKAFGEEIDRRFKTPLIEVNDKSGKEVMLTLSKTQKVNHVITMEDYRQGHRIRDYTIEGYNNEDWIELACGQSVGRKKIDHFPEVNVSKIRLKILKSEGNPLIRNLSVYFVDNFNPPKRQSVMAWAEWKELKTWDLDDDENLRIDLDLTGIIKLPGQYTVKVVSGMENSKIKISGVEMLYDGQHALDKFITVSENEININRTAQVTEETSIELTFMITGCGACWGSIEFRPALIY